jgi:hypothetical protein
MAGEEAIVPRPSKDTPGQSDFAFAREFLDVQRKEIDLKVQDLALRKEGQAQSHDYALKSLSAMAADRGAQRGHRISEMRQYLIFSGIVLLLLLTFSGLALYWNRETIVLEGLKIVGTFAGGLGAGAFFGYRKGQKDTAKSEAGADGEDGG